MPNVMKRIKTAAAVAHATYSKTIFTGGLQMLPNKQTKLNLIIVLIAAALCMAAVGYAAPMGTAFTYQGRLADANSPAEGLYDFEFAVFDALDGGSQQGGTVDVNDLDVIDGYFTVPLDFGGDPYIFSGDARWLEVAVRPGASSDPGDLVTLSPRQELTPTPYSIYAKTAGAGHSLDAADGSPTDAVYVDNDGDVGIGTLSPGAWRLAVMGGTGYGVYADGRMRASHFEDNANATYHLDPADSGTSLVVAGNVGIGTTSPQNKLDVEGTVAVGASYSGTIAGPTNGMIIEGNVGIGTTNPLSRLSVDGDVRVNGNLVVISPSGTISLTDASGATLVMDAENNEITVEDANGNIMTMNSSGTKVEDSNGNVIEMDAAGITVEGLKIIIKGGQVHLGGEGGEPIIKGQSFLNLFATHIHTVAPVVGGPTSPPIPQGEMSTLSTTVKAN